MRRSRCHGDMAVCDGCVWGVAGSALRRVNLPANAVSAGLARAQYSMFENEGTKWALATLGFISLGFLVVPWLWFGRGSG